MNLPATEVKGERSTDRIDCSLKGENTRTRYVLVYGVRSVFATLTSLQSFGERKEKVLDTKLAANKRRRSHNILNKPQSIWFQQSFPNLFVGS